ncbi:hypothetical protein B9479_000394 [Cryptococcus floricola]|uniref:Erythromycin biosynthesis protein CIII-like C-terminal domain-containing protein n=1 Tax=Cryptococcus floricola TaxID=2591691 RepID=A0A5D3B9B1_9TREE|nr:hypothetical protein B9479_000394 [Cryptococcus floricola]
MTETPRKILFLTCSEHGQLNSHLAIISSLLKNSKDGIDIHLGSSSDCRDRVPRGVIFHSIVGFSLTDRIARRHGLNGEAAKEKGMDILCADPGFFNSLKWSTIMFPITHPEPVKEYIETAHDVERLLRELKPDLVIVDTLFGPARDAIGKMADVRFITLSPNTVKEVAVGDQGLGAFLWPAHTTGFPFPVPWYLVPLNIIALLFPLLYLNFSSYYKAFDKARHASGYQKRVPLFEAAQVRPSKTLCMSTPGAEIPAIIPESLLCCGPILQASTPLELADKELYDWVTARPTVMVVLGSHFLTREPVANNMIAAFRVLLDKRRDIQILWKLRKYGEYELQGLEEVGDRLRVVDWLDADPLAVLETGNVICSVNHGGSNSYHEALFTGTPQVLLPAWFDCFDFATRLAFLGNGVWGNMSSGLAVSQPEFTKALLRVIGATPDAPEAAKILARAKELQDIVTDKGTRLGRDVAAAHIVHELEYGPDAL